MAALWAEIEQFKALLRAPQALYGEQTPWMPCVCHKRWPDSWTKKVYHLSGRTYSMDFSQPTFWSQMICQILRRLNRHLCCFHPNCSAQTSSFRPSPWRRRIICLNWSQGCLRFYRRRPQEVCLSRSCLPVCCPSTLPVPKMHIPQRLAYLLAHPTVESVECITYCSTVFVFCLSPAHTVLSVVSHYSADWQVEVTD